MKIRFAQIWSARVRSEVQNVIQGPFKAGILCETGSIDSWKKIKNDKYNHGNEKKEKKDKTRFQRNVI